MSKKKRKTNKSTRPQTKVSEPARPRQLRKLGLRILTILAGCLLGLLFMEIGTRALGIKPERFERPRWQVLHEGMFRDSNIWGNGLIKQPSRFEKYGIQMGEYVPGTVFKCVYPSNERGYFDADNSVTMSVDNLGMRRRGSETLQQKPADTYRILLLGDSFTFGVGVRDEDTFARLLEKELNVAAGAKPVETTRLERAVTSPADAARVEVLNAAVQGYNTRDEVICLEGQWLAFDPDLVLIVFYVNDAYNDSTILNNGEALGVYIEQPAGMARISRVWDLVQHKLQARRASKAVEEFYHEHYFADAERFLEQPGQMKVDWTDCKKALTRAKELAEERGFKLGLVIFPELYYLDERHPFIEIHALVKSKCSELGIPTLDLFETTFRGRKPRELWVHPADHHPNEVAHRLAAEVMVKFVRDL